MLGCIPWDDTVIMRAHQHQPYEPDVHPAATLHSLFAPARRLAVSRRRRGSANIYVGRHVGSGSIGFRYRMSGGQIGCMGVIILVVFLLANPQVDEKNAVRRTRVSDLIAVGAPPVPPPQPTGTGGTLPEDLMLSGAITGHLVSATADRYSANVQRAGVLFCEPGNHEWSASLAGTPYDFVISDSFAIHPLIRGVPVRVDLPNSVTIELNGTGANAHHYRATAGTVTLGVDGHSGTMDVVMGQLKDDGSSVIDPSEPTETVRGTWYCKAS